MRAFTIRGLVALMLAVAGCGDDGIHHLADAPAAPDAPDDASIDAPGSDDVELRLTLAGGGAGVVTSSPSGISCGMECTATFAKSTVVTLTAAPATGAVFAGWSGGCTGTLPTCDVTLANAATVTATFDVARYTVTVTRAGAGAGTVSGNGLACGSTCTITVDHGTMLSLTAAPGNLSTFAGWGGACTGGGTCGLTVTGPTAITANFALDNLTLFVTRGGNGTGTVTSSPSGITCGGDCSETYIANQMITLSAAAGTGSTFTGWSGGGCAGVGACTVTMTAAVTVTATFTLTTLALTVTRAGNGSGAVTSAPTGIACGADCSKTYNYGTMVTLTATPSLGSTFGGWGGSCTGAGACTVTMDMARTVTATFTLDTFTLTVGKLGNGAGTVTGTGISCGLNCSEVLGYGTMVTLTQNASTGSSFTGWGGACSGMGTCTVTMTMARSVSATFTLVTFPLTVATVGNGTITGTGINCGVTCSETFNYGTMVTLTPTPGSGSSFAGWSGACTGAGACTVAMTAVRSVTGTFTVNNYTLMVAPAGNGAGTITGTGINCGAACAEAVPYNTMVTLTATPAFSSTFTGWSAPCSGTGTCTVTMDMARTVSATFMLKKVTLTVSKTGTGIGTVTGTGINCAPDCTDTVDYGTTIVLAALPNTADATASKFDGWSGACSGTTGCSVTLVADTAVTASFTLLPNYIFVTSTVQNGNLGGLAGADAICKAQATAASLPGTYVAYLSTSTVNARSRVGGAKGWVRVDGLPVMNSITDFGGGTLFTAPSLTEAGQDVGQTSFLHAWTGTNPQGTYDIACPNSWMAGSGGEAIVGLVTSATSTAVALTSAICPTENRLYCLGIDRAAVAQ